MTNKKIEKFQAYVKYLINEIETQTINEESKHRFMELVLNYGYQLDTFAYEYFEIQNEGDSYPGLSLFQSMLCEDGFKNPQTENDASRFSGFLDYCTKNADSLLYPNLHEKLCYDKIHNYLINEFLKKQG